MSNQEDRNLAPHEKAIQDIRNMELENRKMFKNKIIIPKTRAREIAEQYVNSSLDPMMSDTPTLRMRIESTINKVENILIKYGQEERERALREAFEITKVEWTSPVPLPHIKIVDDLRMRILSLIKK